MRAIVNWESVREWKDRMLLKGYNLDYSTLQNFEAAYYWATLSPRDKVEDLNMRPTSAPYKNGKTASKVTFPKGPYVIMVFFPKPLVQNMLKDLAVGSDSAETPEASTVPFEDIRKSFEAQILGFVQRADWKLIPEIVHSGLGLGYDVRTGATVNPLDGTPVTDPDVILESRIDRAMIEVSLRIRKDCPQLYSSSCTRLCEVRLPNGDEYNASIVHGGLYQKPQGEKGISSKLRGIHGGLYPQSDLVVADDPLAEIAARTWIDEYKRLDRSQLLRMPYRDWIAQGGEEITTAVKALNGPFLPNTWEGTLDDESDVRKAHDPGNRDDDECNIEENTNDYLQDAHSNDDESNGELDNGKRSGDNHNISPLPSENTQSILWHIEHRQKQPGRKVVTWSHPDRDSDVESYHEE